MKKIVFLALISVLFGCSASTVQIPDTTPDIPVINSNHYRILKNDGLEEMDLSGLIEELNGADVVFIGESHNDPVAHYIEFEVVKRFSDRYGKTAVSMEMFERDVQYILDEYMKGYVQESFLIKDARAWNNYEIDYKPVVEFARENDFYVIAANAPRRYVRIVSTGGLEALYRLSDDALDHIAPLPLKMPPDNKYQQKFFNLMMGNMPAMVKKEDTEEKKDAALPEKPQMPAAMNDRVMRSFHAQVLWDATMAYSIGQYYKDYPGVPIIHFNGSFHSENRLGIVQHLMRDFPKMKIVTITIKSIDTFPEFEKNEFSDLADFIIVADGKLPRTY
ncbi:ChaN family lipoprotein [candidate division KSB1 bacterium]